MWEEKSFDDRSIYMLAIDRKENRRNKEGKKERKKKERKRRAEETAPILVRRSLLQ